MIRRAFAQRSLVEVLLPDGDKLWDPTLRSMDEVLADDALVDHVVEALGRRHLRSRQRGRPGTPAMVVLRMLVLKHLFDWSFDECEREVRANLVYRAFCRIEGERVPDAKTLIRLASLLDGSTLRQLLERLVAMAGERRVVRGRRLRVDTTVVETNIHYPTDSTLLADGVRVLTRTLTRLRTAATAGVVPLRDRTRSVARRVFAITQLSRVNSRLICATFSLPDCATCRGTVSAMVNPDRGGKESAISHGAKHGQVPEAAGTVQHPDRCPRGLRSPHGRSGPRRAFRRS
jgi:IS5 family transposase